MGQKWSFCYKLEVIKITSWDNSIIKKGALVEKFHLQIQVLLLASRNYFLFLYFKINRCIFAIL